MPFFLILTTILSLTTANALPSLNSHSNIQARQASELKNGSWIITYQPNAANSQLYKGPLRVTNNDTTTFISGDLYNGTVLPNPADGSPILPRDNYWAFVRPTKFTPGTNGSFSLGLEWWEFKGFVKRVAYNATKWADSATDGGYTVDMSPKTAPTGYPDAQNYFEGDLKIAKTGATIGHFTMGWVSDYLRRAHVEIGTVQGLEIPKSDVSGTRTWKSIFDEVGYDLQVTVGKTDIPTPGGNAEGPDFWRNEQEHAAMLQYRTPTDFDKEWKMFLLIVRHMVETERGGMIDTGGEYNGIPREGTCITTDWIVGTYANGTVDTKTSWPDSVRNKTWVDLHDPWFRTAVHEVGHFFNLGHPTDYDFVDTVMTDTVTYVDAGAQGVTPKQFPDNITPESFRFRESDRYLMQHRPDAYVRPGWVDFGGAVSNNEPPPVDNLKA